MYCELIMDFVSQDLIIAMSLSFVCWNCRGGTGNSAKQFFIRSLIRKYNLQFFILLEAKVARVSDFLIYKF